MKAKVSICNAVFSDGTKVEFENSGITLMVGPNNAGKSASLKEMHSLLKGVKQGTKVVKEITMSKIGSTEDLISLLSDISKKQNSGNNMQG